MTDEPGTGALPVWKSMLDGHYDVRVTRTEHTHLGLLKITDIRDGRVLLEETVPLSYGAMFGPDISDVRDWQERGIAVIDALPET